MIHTNLHVSRARSALAEGKKWLIFTNELRLKGNDLRYRNFLGNEALMPRHAPVTTLVQLPTGVAVSAQCRVTTDWASVRQMVESGVPYEETAALFKIEPKVIRTKAGQEKWLTPSKVEKLRKELSKRQREVFDQTGETKPVLELKAVLWDERSERWKERMATIVDNSLERTDSVPIEEAKDFEKLVNIARTLTGETQAQDNQPKLAINIGFLRSGNAPRPVLEAEELR